MYRLAKIEPSTNSVYVNVVFRDPAGGVQNMLLSDAECTRQRVVDELARLNATCDAVRSGADRLAAECADLFEQEPQP